MPMVTTMDRRVLRFLRDIAANNNKSWFEAHRDEWAVKTSFTYPGAIQYFGPAEVCDLTTRTLALEKGQN